MMGYIAALAAVSILFGIAFVVLPSLGYPGLATASLMLFFAAGTALAVLARRVPQRDAPVLPARNSQTVTAIQTSTQTEIETETRIPMSAPATTASRNGFSNFAGMMISLFAISIAVGVVVYFVFVSWLGIVPDFNITVGQGRQIPAESYPILLLTLFTVSQRAMAHWRPDGAAWRNVDLVLSVGLAIFMTATLGKAIMTGTNFTFIIVIMAFFVQAWADVFLNGLRREGETASVHGTSAPASAPNKIVTSGAPLVAMGDTHGQVLNFECKGTIKVDIAPNGAVRVEEVEPAAPAPAPAAAPAAA